MMDDWFPPMLPQHNAVTMINGTLGNKSLHVLTAADHGKIQTALRDGSRPLLSSHTLKHTGNHTHTPINNCRTLTEANLNKEAQCFVCKHKIVLFSEINNQPQTESFCRFIKTHIQVLLKTRTLLIPHPPTSRLLLTHTQRSATFNEVFSKNNL